MESKRSSAEFLIEITQEQKLTVSVEAENETRAIELVNSQYGLLEREFPPEILIEKTRVVS
jgi:hypothetical protein